MITNFKSKIFIIIFNIKVNICTQRNVKGVHDDCSMMWMSSTVSFISSNLSIFTIFGIYTL